MNIAVIYVNEFVERVLFFWIGKFLGYIQGFDCNQILYYNGFIDLMVEISFYTKFSEFSIS